MKKVEAAIEPFELDEGNERSPVTRVSDDRVMVSTMDDGVRIRTGERGNHAR